MTSSTSRGSTAAASSVAVPESVGESSFLNDDVQRCERELRAARQRVRAAARAAEQLLTTADLARVEASANAVALAYRQFATAAWELSRARRAFR